MNNNIKKILRLVFICLILSCSGDKIVNDERAIRPISHTDMYNCYHQSEWDSVSVTNELIGRWDWQFIGCFWTPEDDNNTEYLGLTIQFNQDNTLNVVDKGILIETSNWVVTFVDSPNYGIVTEPSVEYLHGRIWFCSDLLEFNNSYIDGCDNIFKKAN